MFKDRLKTTGKVIFENLIVPTLMLVVAATIITFVVIKFPTLVDLAIWGVGIFVSLLLLIGLLVFIHWLFIEPFKKNAN